MYRNIPRKRYDQTIKPVEKYFTDFDQILYLDVQNPLPDIMKEKGFDAINTTGEDLREQ